MRSAIICWIFMVGMGCTTRKPPSFIPAAFRYPIDSIGSGKTFVFHDSLHGEDLYLALRSFVRGTDTLQSYTRYTASRTMDSQIVKNGHLVETYAALSSIYPTLYTGDRIAEETISDGSRLGTNKLTYTYRNDTITATYSGESHFLKDTVILWKGERLPCLVIQSTSVTTVRSAKYVHLNYHSTTQFIDYVAKNLGRIRFVMTFTDKTNAVHHSVWNLTDIEEGSEIMPPR